MRLPQIVTHLTDTDMYKFTMGQAIFHQFPDYMTEWMLKCRNKDVWFTPEMVQEIREQLQAYCTLRYTEEELAFLGSIPWIKTDYIRSLRRWYPQWEDFYIAEGGPNGLILETRGTWLDTSQYEIACLFITNEVYFRMSYNYGKMLKSFAERLEAKARRLEPPISQIYLRAFSEFGTRRRLSKEAQEMVIRRLMNLRHSTSKFVGTSNVYFSMVNGTMPTGTIAHEYPMCVGQGNPEVNPAFSNRVMMRSWVKEYGTENGIALTDTITTDCFNRDFTKEFATLFKGVRHDSGDPFVWGDKMIAKYKELGIDPTTKTLLFSDSLDFDKANEIYWYFRERADMAFGIGTFFTNDVGVVDGVEITPLNIVMKVTNCNGYDVAKLSDAEGKTMCKNPEYVDYLKRSIAWRMCHKD